MNSETYIQNVVLTTATPKDKANCLASELRWLLGKKAELAETIKATQAEADEDWSAYKAAREEFIQLGIGSVIELKSLYHLACETDLAVCNLGDEAEDIDASIKRCREKLADLLDILEVDWLLGC